MQSVVSLLVAVLLSVVSINHESTIEKETDHPKRCPAIAG
jgi:hypothetical protein